MSYPDVNYLSVSLELNESGNGEMKKLTASPQFDTPRMQIAVIDDYKDKDDDEYEVFVELNRAQIQCLTDFLVAWLQHAPKLDQAADFPPQRPLAEGAGPSPPTRWKATAKHRKASAPWEWGPGPCTGLPIFDLW